MAIQHKDLTSRQMEAEIRHHRKKIGAGAKIIHKKIRKVCIPGAKCTITNLDFPDLSIAQH